MIPSLFDELGECRRSVVKSVASPHSGERFLHGTVCSSPLALVLGLFIAATPLCGCDESSNASSRVNGTVHVRAGTGAGAADTVNGGIDVDANAAVTSA